MTLGAEAGSTVGLVPRQGGILIDVAFLTSYLPARRASLIDPGVALRME